MDDDAKREAIMQVQVTGKKIEITPALRNFVAGKMSKLEEVFPHVKKVAVVLTVEKYRHTAEIHFRADGVEMSAKKTTKDMYASIEQGLGALEQQASKRKDRLHTQGAHRRADQRNSKLSAKAGRLAKADAATKASAKAPKLKVTKVKNSASKPLSLEAAAAHLSSSGEGFVLYRDAETGSTQLLFRREDGSIGLMEA
jgi:putative sigma-54 modulation protein